MSFPNQKDVLDHLLTKSLEMDKEDINTIKDAIIRLNKQLIKIFYDKLDRFRDKHNMSTCYWRELIY